MSKHYSDHVLKSPHIYLQLNDDDIFMEYHTSSNLFGSAILCYASQINNDSLELILIRNQ